MQIPADGAKKVRVGNRRATIRYRCAPATLGKVYRADDHEFQRACVLDLSVKGVGILVNRKLEPGEMIQISIRGNDKMKVFDLYAQVAHVDTLPMGEWIIGCELLVPLSADDLDQLL